MTSDAWAQGNDASNVQGSTSSANTPSELWSRFPLQPPEATPETLWSRFPLGPPRSSLAPRIALPARDRGHDSRVLAVVASAGIALAALLGLFALTTGDPRSRRRLDRGNRGRRPDVLVLEPSDQVSVASRRGLRAADSLTVVIPAYNEEACLRACVLETSGVLLSLGLEHEIVVVDDGSTDGTWDVISSVSREVPNVRGARLDRNRGKGAALTCGAHIALGTFVAFLDADLEIHPSELTTLRDRIVRDRADIVVGSKQHPQSRVDQPRFRRLLSRAFNLLVRVCFRLGIQDTQTGIKLFRRRSLVDLQAALVISRFAHDLELLLHARTVGLRVSEVPVVVTRQRPASRISILDMARMLTDTARIWLRAYLRHAYRPNRAIVRPGAAGAAGAGAAWQQMGFGGPPSASADRTDDRLGDVLVASRTLSPDRLQRALAAQAAHGSRRRVGELLVASGDITQDELAEALGRQLSLPSLGAHTGVLDASIGDLLPEDIARRHRLAPLGARGNELRIAVTDPLDLQALEDVERTTWFSPRAVVASPDAVAEIQERVYPPGAPAKTARGPLGPGAADSAGRVLSRGQVVVFSAVLAASVTALALQPIPTLVALNLVAAAVFSASLIFKLGLAWRSVLAGGTPRPSSPLADEYLPTYTILVPLYKEAAVVARLVFALTALDYPPDRVTVMLLVEVDDDETIEAIEDLKLPPRFQLVRVPDEGPKTKPKACNYGLARASSELLVIFDAEDRPEPDQLRRVAEVFAAAPPDVSCVQCKLDYYNPRQNVLTRWFTAEYAMWFNLLLPGLDSSRAPIPLGGTSNHFVTRDLLRLGGWDPHNVAEDADLGVRLHKYGHRTMTLDSTTFEEAAPNVGVWIRQRSRWVKGYMQTWLVHMRHPVRLYRDIGARAWLSFQFLVGGTFFSYLLSPIFWALAVTWLLTEASVIESIFPPYVYYAASASFLIGTYVFIQLLIAGALERGYLSLVKFAIAAPVYWLLMSIAAWKALWQLVTRPTYWEKTTHGLSAYTSTVDEEDLSHVGSR